jgi:hypothetical protein
MIFSPKGMAVGVGLRLIQFNLFLINELDVRAERA